MHSVNAVNLSLVEADDLLATIWISLERHGLTSPKIAVSQRSTNLKIEILFKSRSDMNVVMAELPPEMARKIQGRIPKVVLATSWASWSISAAQSITDVCDFAVACLA